MHPTTCPQGAKQEVLRNESQLSFQEPAGGLLKILVFRFLSHTPIWSHGEDSTELHLEHAGCLRSAHLLQISVCLRVCSTFRSCGGSSVEVALAAMACDYNGYIFLDDPIPDPAQTPAAHTGTLSTFYVCAVASLSFGLLMLCCHCSRRDKPVAVTSDRLRG